VKRRDLAREHLDRQSSDDRTQARSSSFRRVRVDNFRVPCPIDERRAYANVILQNRLSAIAERKDGSRKQLCDSHDRFGRIQLVKLKRCHETCAEGNTK
jgi:hypothetical protein